jgi:DNA-binding LytR/AlgR family response regulator
MKEFFFIRQNGKLHRIVLNDVLFIEGLRNYCRIHTKNGVLVTLKTMKELESWLPENDFMRIHKSYIVSIKNIFQVTKSEVCLTKSQCIPVGETFRPKLRSFISGNLL